MNARDNELSEKPAVPRHVAIIMDGNGRWAKNHGLPREKGHEEGAESVRAVMRAARDTGVQYLTLYAFSVENWIRPKAEVSSLMRLLGHFLKRYEHELHENQVRLRVIGQMSDLPTNSLQSKRIKVRCKQCHSRLCDRIEIKSGWTLHFKRGTWEVFSTEMWITCGNCKQLACVNTDGILECLTTT